MDPTLERISELVHEIFDQCSPNGVLAYPLLPLRLRHVDNIVTYPIMPALI